ncbi:ribonuclease H-like domain-containing protein [Rhizophagus clarus]|uniref:Ribonuclease H-like domain-containing protein n=2 Tax=Rhizophagus clarus TaxID=94130 RepID=A0A8H3MHL2_9GLOM|nr:ribonuclease H-like domain-containing protein [Rhizophagus clarus]
MAPLKKLFKHKFNLSTSTPNYVIYNSLFPYINDLFANQVKSQSSILTALFNTPILSPIALHKITYTLKELWLPFFPLSIIPFYNTLVRPTYLTKAIRLLNSYNINILPNFDLTTLQGRYPIRNYVLDLDAKTLKSLSRKRILYMDHNHRRLITPLHDIIVYNYNVTHPHIPKNTHDNNIYHPRSQFIAFWNNNCPKEKADLVLGKTIEQDNIYDTSITFFQHYIPLSLTAMYNSNTSLTPNSSHHAIYPYPGCHIREPNYRLGYKYTCIGSIKTSSCNIIKTTPYNHDWVRKFNSTYLPKTSLLLNKPLHLIRLTSYNDYLNLFLSTPTSYNTSNRNDSTSNTTYLPVFSSFDFDFSFVSKYGSLSHIGTPECRYGFGWIQVAPNTPRLQFQGCSCFSPSSTRAEIFSILTVLLSIPSNSSELVFQKHLLVTFVKVKAHNGIADNDIADNLAKAGALGTDPILINPRFISTQLATVIWNGMAPIITNIRKFCNTPTAAAEFTRLMNSSLYAPITNSILANLIDWNLTSKWIKYNPLDSPTS